SAERRKTDIGRVFELLDPSQDLLNPFWSLRYGVADETDRNLAPERAAAIVHASGSADRRTADQRRCGQKVPRSHRHGLSTFRRLRLAAAGNCWPDTRAQRPRCPTAHR